MKRDELIINKIMVDWVTFTTYSRLHFDSWCDRYTYMTDWLNEVSTFEQYKGVKKTGKIGTTYVGSGKQGHRDHYIANVTGMRADADVQGFNLSHLTEQPRCTRIDIQATIIEPPNHNQVILFNVLEEMYGTKVYTRSSSDGGIDTRTIYVEKSDDELIRIYQKYDDINKRMLLRYEVQYRNHETNNGKAIRVCNDIWANPRTIESIFNFSVVSLGERYLHKRFGYISSLAPKKASVIQPGQRDTRAWLFNTVTKSLHRYLENNRDDKELIDRYRRILDDTEDKES